MGVISQIKYFRFSFKADFVEANPQRRDGWVKGLALQDSPGDCHGAGYGGWPLPATKKPAILSAKLDVKKIK